MRAATVSRFLPVAPKSSLVEAAPGIRAVRILIWTYLVLLLIEGALRKWFLPNLSDPLLIVRDPVALAIYFVAWRANVFPRNAYVAVLAIIGGLSLAVGLLNLYSFNFPIKQALLVTLYGFRSNFLHLPLIFVIANVFDHEDVKKVGWWTLMLMIPMAALMVAQFKASPDSFINKTVGIGEAQQLATAGGKIRPPATFSFISGPVFYLSATAAFVIYGALTKTAYKSLLLLSSAAAVLIGVTVSGSRSCVAAVIVVVLAVVVILVVRPSAVNNFGRILVAIVVVALIASRLPSFKEGVDVLAERFTTSAEAAETTVVGGMVQRVLEEFTDPFKYINKVPFWGYALGLGTAGGARFLVGQGALLLTENEWMRIIGESGPLLGLAFILWRVALTAKLFFASLRSLKGGEVLSILLFSCAFLGLLNGQLGQPTTLGCTVVLCGLCLAATRQPELSAVESEIAESIAPKRLPRLSPHAERLRAGHSGPDHANGSVDR